MGWWKEFRESSTRTKWFIFNWIFYAILTLITLVYVYARLDYVRSGPVKTLEVHQR